MQMTTTTMIRVVEIFHSQIRKEEKKKEAKRKEGRKEGNEAYADYVVKKGVIRRGDIQSKEHQ